MPPAPIPPQQLRDPKKGKQLQRLAIILAIVTVVVLNLLGLVIQNTVFNIILSIIAIVIFIKLLKLYLLGKKHLALSVDQILAVDHRPPVVYLRSFQDDSKAAAVMSGGVPFWALVGLASKKTEEEMLVDQLTPFGPVIAIGRPGEELPELGAARMYVDSSVWHNEVEAQLDKAALVVLRLGSTEGLWWELEHSIGKIKPERFIVIVPHIRDRAKLQTIYDRACSHFPKSLPPFSSARKLHGRTGSLRGFIYFDADWAPHYVDVTRRNWPFSHFFRFQGFAGNEARITWALHPVYNQLGVPWTLPPIRWGPAIIICIALGLPVLLILALLITAVANHA
jgi:hypothetical protein